MAKITHFVTEHTLLSILVLIPLIGIFFLVSCKTSKPEGEEEIPRIQTNVKHADWTKNATIYEVNLRQYSENGSLKSFQEHLPRLKEMGIDILWLMPIHPIGVINRKATPDMMYEDVPEEEKGKYLGSYYSVKDYFGIDSMYGTMDEFKAFVAEAHKLEMKVILDWVANHTAWDNPWITEHPDWYTRDDSGNMIAPFDWTDVAELDYENKDMRAEMIKALKFWMEEAKVDGYRCDVAMEVPTDFWNEVRPELEAINPDVFMLAEAESPELQIDAFDAYYGWELHHIGKEIAQGKKSALHIDSYFMKKDTLFPKGTMRMNFTSNHDENSWNGTVYERYGDAVKTMAVLMNTLPDMPLVYSGQEAGMNHKLKFFEKDQVEWKDHEFAELYKIMFELKKRNKALWNGEFGGELVKIESINKEKVYAFSREKDGDKVMAFFNLSKEQTDLGATFTKEQFGTYKDIITGKEYLIDKKFQLKLQPWEYFVLEGVE